MVLIESRTEERRRWLVSLARRKLGAAIEEKSCKSFEQPVGDMCCIYAEMLFIIASRAGYTAFKFPLLVVMRVWMDCKSKQLLAKGVDHTNRNQIICIGSSEAGDTDSLWKGLLSLEFHVQTLPKIRLDAHRLQNEDAHSDHSLFGRIIPIFYSVEDTKNYKVM